MSKYIIKNCPAYDYDEEFDYHICKQPLVPYECSVDNCKDCADCVMKQIVKQAGCCLCPEILELLDIEEVE